MFHHECHDFNPSSSEVGDEPQAGGVSVIVSLYFKEWGTAFMPGCPANNEAQPQHQVFQLHHGWKPRKVPSIQVSNCPSEDKGSCEESAVQEVEAGFLNAP